MCKLFRKASVTNWYKQWEDDKDVNSDITSDKMEFIPQKRLAPWYYQDRKIAENLRLAGIREPKRIAYKKAQSINPNK